MEVEEVKQKYQNRIQTLKSKKGFNEAYKRLLEKRDITTADLKYFGISFESFIRYAQLPDAQCKKIIDNLIETFK
jgi:hypothetical protein